MSASNHEILSAVSIASTMTIEGLIVSAGYTIPRIRTDDRVRNAVIGVARPTIAAAADDDLRRWATMSEQALDEALDAEATPQRDCDCWNDCGHGAEDNEIEYASNWLEVVSEELVAACDRRGISRDNSEPF